MESNKLGKKIREWAINLGFRMPDGSSPPSDYFALLTVTPNRRQLWEVIIETVQARQKIEQMRKQILVAKLQNKSLYSKKSFPQEKTDRIKLWHKKNELEDEIKEKSNAVLKLKERVLAKASDLVFEVCKLAEIEKQLEELKDRLLVLKLFTRKEKKLVGELERNLVEVSSLERFGNEEKGVFIDQLLNMDKCECLNDGNCSLSGEIDKLGVSEQYLWDEFVTYKKNLLQQFSDFLMQLNTTEKNILSEKAMEIEQNVNQLITQLKQKITEKCLQVVMNSTKGKLLDVEIQKLEEKLMGNEVGSFMSSFGINDSYEENERSMNSLKSFLAIKSLKTYKEYLREEIGRSGDVLGGNESSREEEAQSVVHEFDSIINEINTHKSDEKEILKEILNRQNEIESIHQSLKAEAEKMKKTVEKTAGNLKWNCSKQIDLYLEIPMDAFKTFETSSGRIAFECESESHCLENYKGELKQFFSGMLLPPETDFRKIVIEIKNRKRISDQVKKFISEREKLERFGKQIQNQVSCVSYDRALCERNYKESDGILWNCFSKTEQLEKEIDFVEKILKSWVEQPFRFMITGQLDGKSLKDYDELYRKGNKL